MPALQLLFFLSFLVLPLALQANSTPSWQALRAQIRETKNFRLGAPQNIQVLADGRTVLYLRAEPPSPVQSLYALDRESGQERLLVAASAMEAGGGEISHEEKALRERLRLQTSGISFYSPDPKGEKILIPYRGKLYVWTLQTSSLLEIAKGRGAIFQARWSPDGKWVAYVRDYNLFIAPTDGGAERALTQGGTEAKSYGLAEFVAQEELSRQEGFWWSPDSRQILVQETDQTSVERLVISDPSRPEQEPQRPYYPRAGQQNARTRLGLVSLEGGKIEWLDFGSQAFEYLAAAQWDETALTIQVFDRLQKHLRLLMIDPRSLGIRLLVEEKDPAWVQHEAKFPIWLKGGKNFLWMSERSGAGVLELRTADGLLVRSLTDPKLGLQEWGGLDGTQTKALLQASDRSETSSLYVLDLKEGKLAKLREESKGQVTLASPSKANLYVYRSSLLTGEDRLRVGSFSDTKESEIPSLTPKPLLVPKVEVLEIGADGVRVSVTRPQSFRKGKRYPAVEQVYGGPGSQMVRLAGRAYLGDQVLADALDAFVVRMDTRGTPGRGRHWERAIAGKFGSLPVQEHADIWQLLWKKFPEIDSKRIGVTGWSYGGYFAAYAAIQRGDVYRAAVVGAPPVDWLDYDTAYTERYLGLPAEQPEAYRTASLLALLERRKAAKTSPMLIFHGTADDNVYFNQSLKLVDALERGARPYEFVPLVGMTHMISDPLLDERRFLRSLEFFQRQLSTGGQVIERGKVSFHGVKSSS